MFPFSDASVHHTAFPYVNSALIGVSVVVFLYEMYLGGFGTLTGKGHLDLDIFFFKWGFIAQELTSGTQFLHRGNAFIQYDIETPVHTVFTFFTSMFIHGGFMHIAGNMMFLWVFGDNIEDKFGHVRYLIFYLVTGIAATLVQWAINTDSQVPLIGASGAISGVLGAYLVIYPHNKSPDNFVHNYGVGDAGHVVIGRVVCLAVVSRNHISGYGRLCWRGVLCSYWWFRGRDSISGRLQAF